MISDITVIQQVVLLLKAKGIQNIIISPGSRNAPFSISINQDSFFKTYVVPDERVAAFIGMGMSQANGKPTALICTSGSAVLNYFPAVAEADYQHIPLIVISADRPAEWIDQADGQTIRQVGALKNHIKAEGQLNGNPSNASEKWYNERSINEVINSALTAPFGPVHINVPLNEPLYNQVEKPAVSVKNIERVAVSRSLTNETKTRLINTLKNIGHVFVLAGLQSNNETLQKLLSNLVESRKVTVFTETTSNLHHPDFVTCIDRTIEGLTEDDNQKLKPNLLITIGGPIVSKKIKFWLRKNTAEQHWHVGHQPTDTYMCLTHHLDIEPEELLELLDVLPTNNSASKKWVEISRENRLAHQTFVDQVPFSDMFVFNQINQTLPENAVVQQGNSSVVRYMQLYDWKAGQTFYGNRGTSGIDGSTSTAVGFATQTDKPVVMITGDISFFYDSNAFFHQHVPDNLKVILINNQGGSIFRIINGPSGTNELERYFESHHQFNAKGIADAYSVDFKSIDQQNQVKSALEDLYQSKKATILEICTPRFENDQVLKDYFRAIKTN